MDLETIFTVDILYYIFELCDLSTFLRFRYFGREINAIIEVILEERVHRIIKLVNKKTCRKVVVTREKVKLSKDLVICNRNFLFYAVLYSKNFAYEGQKICHVLYTLQEINKHYRGRRKKAQSLCTLFEVIANRYEFLLEHLKFYDAVVDKLFSLIINSNVYFDEHIHRIMYKTCVSKKHKRIFIEKIDKYIQYPDKNLLCFKYFINFMTRLRGIAKSIKCV